MGLPELFPEESRGFWSRALAGREKDVTEIRLRAGQPAYLMMGEKEYLLTQKGDLIRRNEGAKCFSRQELAGFFSYFCQYSPYAYEEELREGYLTLEGGHRLGVAGQMVTGGGQIRTIKNIAFLNLRIAHQILGAADPVLPLLYRSGEVKSTLIVAPPGCGKTTLLRDLIRQVSEGNVWGTGRSVGVVDERSELSGAVAGVPQNQLGSRTDVMTGCPKKLGMELLIRSMAPRVIAVDELGGDEAGMLIRTRSCGVSLIATIHGRGKEDLVGRVPEGLFELILFLGLRNGIPHIVDHWERET